MNCIRFFLVVIIGFYYVDSYFIFINYTIIIAFSFFYFIMIQRMNNIRHCYLKE